jgi:hypothetical protein
MIVREARSRMMPPAATDRVRRPGAGRPALSQSNPALRTDLPRSVESTAMSDRMRPLSRVSECPVISIGPAKPARARCALNQAAGANTRQNVEEPGIFPENLRLAASRRRRMVAAGVGMIRGVVAAVAGQLDSSTIMCCADRLRSKISLFAALRAHISRI